MNEIDRTNLLYIRQAISIHLLYVVFVALPYRGVPPLHPPLRVYMSISIAD
jgi:hypothetical protein